MLKATVLGINPAPTLKFELSPLSVYCFQLQSFPSVWVCVYLWLIFSQRSPRSLR